MSVLRLNVLHRRGDSSADVLINKAPPFSSPLPDDDGDGDDGNVRKTRCGPCGPLIGSVFIWVGQGRGRPPPPFLDQAKIPNAQCFNLTDTASLHAAKGSGSTGT